MTDKEILAELKKSYEYLTDIRDNGCVDHCNGQLNMEMVNMLNEAKRNIEDIYFDFYKTLNKEDLRVKELEDDEKVYIARTVEGDYEVGEDFENMTCEEAGYYWYDEQERIDINLPSSFYINIEYDKEEKMVWIDSEDGSGAKYPCNNINELTNAIKYYCANYLIDECAEEDKDKSIWENINKLSDEEFANLIENLLKVVIPISSQQNAEFISKRIHECIDSKKELNEKKTDEESDLGVM